MPRASTVMARAVVLRTVNSARKRSPSRTSGGSPGSSIRSCVVRIDVPPDPKRSSRRGGDGLDAEAGERVVERDLDARLAALVQRDARRPQEQGVEQLAGRLPAAAAARRRRLLAVVALADHLELRRRGAHAVAAPPHHGAQHVPAAVGREGEQPLVDHGDGDLAARRRRGAAAGARTAMVAAAGIAHAVGGAVGRDGDVELVRARPADLDLGDAEAERGAAEVDRRRRLHVADAAADRQHGDERRSAPSRRPPGARSRARRRTDARRASAPTPSRSSVTSAVASRNGMRTWKRAVSPGS